MAPGRFALGWLVAAAAISAAAVAGCGGGSPSASGSASQTSATTTTTKTTPVGAEGAVAAEGGGVKAGTGDDVEKAGASATGDGAGGSKHKHPPIELPTGAPEKAPPKSERPPVPTVAMKLSLPQGLAVADTCKGKNESPELTWSSVPPGTVELAVFAVNMQPVNGDLHFDWAMAGIDPALEGLKQGEVPAGAVLGRNGDGQSSYSLCPKDSGTEMYIFSVYAITKRLSPKQGFDPLDFRLKATRTSEENGIVAVPYAAE